MNKNTKKIYSFALAGIMALTGLVTAVTYKTTPEVHAQCSADGTQGNLLGYANTENGYGKIFFSTESWEQYTGDTTNDEFATSYNRQTGEWSGTAWSETVGRIVFYEVNGRSIGIIDEIDVDHEGTSEKDRYRWGNMDHRIYFDRHTFYEGTADEFTSPGLSYNINTGEFEGYAYHGSYTGTDTNSSSDELVGLGVITLHDLDPGDGVNESVRYEESPCNESVDLSISPRTGECPIINPTISWASTNIQADSCRATGSNNGLWRGSRPGISGREQISGSVSESDGILSFRLTCRGQDSNRPVTSNTVTVACGDNVIDDEGRLPSDDTFIPDFKEV